MKLQILVPQYKEDDSVVKPLLDSIALQQAIDFRDVGVIIVNDGTDARLSDGLLNAYPFEIRYYLAEHGGVSATRDRCFDYATADYVMWCDADDMFHTVTGLWVIFSEIANGGFDALVSAFVEETKDPLSGSRVFVVRGATPQEADSTFVHGKVYRRQYLVKNGIRWNHALTVHEDGYFNILGRELARDVKFCPNPFYLWAWRDESVCRHDPKYILKTYGNMIESNDALVGEFLRRKMFDKAGFYTAFLVFDAYYLMNKEEWIDHENKEYRDATERRFAQWFKDHKDLWEDLGDMDRMAVSNGIRQRMVMEGMRMEQVTLGDWLAHIESLL